METCGHGDADHREYSREYKKIAKILYPDMYAKKKRKSSQTFIRTLRKCECGQKGWEMLNNSETGKVKIYCKGCPRSSDECDNKSKARDSWNKTFDKQ